MTNDNAERDPAAAPAAPEPEPDPLALQAQRIQELEGEVARAKDQALRALAEAENVRRRTARELEDRSKFAVEGFARELLDVADNLRRALDAIAPEQRAQDALLEKLAAGVELTERRLLAILERHGIKPIDAVGQPFDHNLHQAMLEVDLPDRPPGTIVQAFQTGYTMHGRLLRPAMVSVARGGSAEPGTRVDTTA